MKINKSKEFDRDEFEKHLIKDDDITLTSCCNRKYYKTKKHLKCSKCKKVVTKDIVARAIMQGIDQMTRKNDEPKDKGSSEAQDDKS